MSPDPGAWGVAPGYHSISGAWVEPRGETVEAVLAAMGAGDGPPPPPAAVTVRTDHPLPPLGPGRLELEDGAEVDVDERLPPGIPHGYHRFTPHGSAPFPLVVSPGTAPVPDRREWGFATQLYAARSRRSWGIGDLGDLAELCRWSAELGAGFVLVNPLHAPNPSGPRQASPYYPGSRCFMDPIYLRVEDVPGATGTRTAELGAAGRRLNGDRLIDRDRVWDLKSSALEAAFAGSRATADLVRYVLDRGRPLRMFAAFAALAEIHGPSWRAWPAQYRHPSGGAVEAFAAGPGRGRVRFHCWLQWLLSRQAAGAAAHLGLVQDLAVGVDPSGPDSWVWQDCFAEGMRVGAPPDEFNTLGQDWGLPPFDPWRLRAGAYEPWIEALRSGFRHGAGLRIDHVMGLFRLYWIPPGTDARFGAYVRYPHHDLLNILTLEAQRAGASVVGEDLGTVEDAVRADLSERRVLSYRVWWFEDRPAPQWPAPAMGAVTTHDLPTVAGVLTGTDLEAQRRIGMEPNEEASAALRDRLLERTGCGPGDDPAAVVEAAYADLGEAPCVLLTVALDDVLAVEERPNMPGTTDAWPNWCLALPAPLEEIEEADLPARVAARLRGRP